MSAIIEVKNLGKKYTIGEKEKYLAMRDILMNIVRAPFSWLKAKTHTGSNASDFWALKDINFNVEQGEVLGIIGRNGAGKSTLLKVLSRITPPTTGEIRLRGRVGSLLEVGTGFHPELTGRENIYLNGAILGMRKKEIERKFDEIVEFSGVQKFLDTPVKRYSSGMYVRLAFSVAAHLEPDILIVDEVLAVGDAEFQKKCLGKMQDVTKKDGRTVLLVSHNMEAIRNLCTRCVLLDKGAKVFEGSTNDALSEYNKMQINRELRINKGEYNQFRRGSGTLSFTHIEMLDYQNIGRHTFHIKETVKFKLSYQVFTDVKGLWVNVALFSAKAYDVVITEIPFEITKNIVKKETSGTVMVEVDLTNIRAGEYRLCFWLGDAQAREQGVPINYDLVEDMTERLVVISNNEEEKKLLGVLSLPARITRL